MTRLNSTRRAGRAAAFALLAGVNLAIWSTDVHAICGRKSCVVRDTWSAPISSTPTYTAPAASRSASSSGPAPDISNRPIAGYWYCEARAGNGAKGWGSYEEQSTATQRALNECHQHSRGRACSIRYCNLGGPTRGKREAAVPNEPRVRTTPINATAAPLGAAPDRVNPACWQCETELRNSIRARLGAANRFLLPKWVNASIAGFKGCEQRSVERNCFLGQITVRTLQSACDGFKQPSLNADAYESCIGRAIP